MPKLKKRFQKEQESFDVLVIQMEKEYFEYRKKEYIPQCVDSSCCGRAVKRFNTPVEAISAWNTHAPILSAEALERLEEIYK